MSTRLLTEFRLDDIGEIPYRDLKKLHKLKMEKDSLVSALEHEFSSDHLQSSSVQDLRKLAEKMESVTLKYESEIEEEVEQDIEGAFAGIKNLARITGQNLRERFSGLINLYCIMRRKL